jgi:hypothetical protein
MHEAPWVSASRRTTRIAARGRVDTRTPSRRGPSIAASRPLRGRSVRRVGAEYVPGTHWASILLRNGMEFDAVVQRLEAIGLTHALASSATTAARAELNRA